MAKIMRVSELPTHSRCGAILLLKKTNRSQLAKDNAMHIANNCKVCFISEFAFGVVDKLSPIIKRYPKLGNLITLTCEKLILTSEKAKKNKLVKIL